MSEFQRLAADIIIAYCEANRLPVADLPPLIASVHNALLGTNASAASQEEGPKLTVAQIRKTLANPDFIVSLEDGKPYRSMKRHLAGRGLTPDAYRQKWGLDRNYPMTSPTYSATRSALARALGLGRKDLEDKQGTIGGALPPKAPEVAQKPAKASRTAKPARSLANIEKTGPHATVPKAKITPRKRVANT